jgi:hypothetical protein
MMIQPTRRRSAIATIHRGEFRTRAHASESEPVAVERCAAAAVLDSMCGLFVADEARPRKSKEDEREGPFSLLCGMEPMAHALHD